MNEISSGGGLLDRCLEIAEQIAAANGDSIAAQMRALREVGASALGSGLDIERRALERWDERA